MFKIEMIFLNTLEYLLRSATFIIPGEEFYYSKKYGYSLVSLPFSL